MVADAPNPVDLPPEARALGVELLSFYSSGRRPAFWEDFAVRVFLAELHRQVTIARALDSCREKFGAARTPSKSALQRFWAALDDARRRKAKRKV